MSTISSSTQAAHRPSPLAQLQKTLASEIASGKINSADQSALSSALDSIDSAMKSAANSGTRPSPAEGKAKVQSMISDMVADGTLTSDQAEELNSVFEDTFKGGPGGAKGKNGPPPPPPGDDDSEDNSDQVSLTLTGSGSDVSALLKQLLESLASTGKSTYSAKASSNSSVSSLFLDKTA